MEQGRAIAAVQRAEPREERRDSVGARGLELLDVDRERVARLGSLDEEGPRLRVVMTRQLDLGRQLAGRRDGAVVAVLAPADDPRAGRDVVRRCDPAEGVLELLVLGNVPQRRPFLSRRTGG